jgi:hypothetical protein
VRPLQIGGDAYEPKDTASMTFGEFRQFLMKWSALRNNVAPGAMIPAVRQTDGDIEGVALMWGADSGVVQGTQHKQLNVQREGRCALRKAIANSVLELERLKVIKAKEAKWAGKTNPHYGCAYAALSRKGRGGSQFLKSTRGLGFRRRRRIFE